MYIRPILQAALHLSPTFLVVNGTTGSRHGIFQRMPFAVAFLLVTLAGRQAGSDLDTVLKRATDYVTQYEADLGNLIGTEEYVQSSTWMDASNPPRVGKRMQRRTSSDFLIIQVGSEWSALRKVNRVDGVKVKETTPAFEEAFDDSPAANARRLNDMQKESTAQNLGDIRRDINLPTFGLHVLRKSEVGRFSFQQAGTAKINGKQAWKIKFREVGGPTLVTSGKGDLLYSTGTLWVEPESGRVFQTEFELVNPFGVIRVRGRILVTYDEGKNVPILVPASMVETYESTYNNIECRAEYSRFRPFEVDVKFDINLPQSR